MSASPPLRAPGTVMRLAQLGAAHMSRLSFSRSIVQRARKLGWQLRRERFDLDGQGYGRAVYAVDLGGHVVSLVAFSHHLPDDLRMDRVIATAWDTTYVLYDGLPDAAELNRLAASVPRQEASRYSRRELILARANRSVRSFEDVVEALAAGRQPEARSLREAGYLLRTSAVYGNGKFGIADRDEVVAIPGLEGAFAAEMLTVWLIRSFSVDLAEHCAMARAAAWGHPAARLSPEIRRDIGIGNSTGLGMAPFIIRHPLLLHRWIETRELALARALDQTDPDPAWRARMAQLIGIWTRKTGFWITSHSGQTVAIAELRSDLPRLGELAATAPDPRIFFVTAERELGREAAGLAASLVIDADPDPQDDGLSAMAVEGQGMAAIDCSGSCGDALASLQRHYDWALALDFTSPDADARFWYTSQDKLEPRIGWRGSDEGDALEQPLGIAREMQRLAQALEAQPAGRGLDVFMAERPDCRYALRRLQLAVDHPYAEIRENLLEADIRPRDLMRAKLAFLGADFFDPSSDMSVKVRFFQGAPYPDDPSPEAGDGLW